MTPIATPSFWDRHNKSIFNSAVLFLLFYSAVRSILKAAIRPFWFDELLTWIVARQPNLSSLWRSLAQAADGQPPPYYVLERIFSKLASNDQIAFRLPSILAFCLMEWSLFVWLKKRHDISIAFVGTLIPLMTTLYFSYTVEARPYCLLAACLSVALVAYQRVPSLPWIFLLAISIFASQSFHYYALFVVSPLFAAEAVFFLKTSSLRWPVWIALFAGVSPVLVFWPILSNFKAYYSGHYWSHPDFLASLRSYGWLFGLAQGSASVFSGPLLVGLFLTTTVFICSAFFLLQAFRANPQVSPFFHEQVAIAGILLLPIVLYCAAKLSGGGFTPRYLLPVVVGIVLAAGRGLSHLSHKTLLLVGALLILAIAVQESAFWFSYYGDFQLGFARPKPVEQLVSRAGHADLPVIISDGHDYLEANHYATPEWKHRLIFVADPAAAVLYGRPDTTEKELIVLRDFTALHVFRADELKPSLFLLYSHPTSENNPDWWVLRLVADGYSLKNLATDGQSTVYLVESKHAE